MYWLWKSNLHLWGLWWIGS